MDERSTQRAGGGTRAVRVLVAFASLACALLLAAPSPARAVSIPVASPILSSSWPLLSVEPMPSAGSQLPSVLTWVDPPVPDGVYGWRLSMTRVIALPDRPAEVYYRWSAPGSRWTLYTGPLLVPEGRQTLSLRAIDPLARVGPIAEIPLKADYTTPSGASSAEVAAGVGASGTGLGSSDSVAVTARRSPSSGPRVIRVAGPDRYGTSEQISITNFDSATTVLVARGDTFPDALAASGLAGVYRAPIELTRPGHLPGNVVREIRRLGASRAIIVGGTLAVSPVVEDTLRGLGLDVERIGGADRYETAALVARAVAARGGETGQAVVARGDSYSDALSFSAPAWRAKLPMVLVRPDALPPVSAAAITDLGVHTTIVAGSERAVSATVAAGLDSLPTVHSLVRVGGDTRYDTACAAAEYASSAGMAGWGTVGIATGENFPDALCGGAAVGAKGGVILLTPTAVLAAGTDARLRGHGDALRDVQVFGSERAVSKASWDAVIAAIR